jgi:cytochrome c peroxidase
MTRKPIRVLAAVAAIVIAGFAVAFVARDDSPKGAAFVDMNHGDVKLAKGQLQRVLNAIDTQTSQVSNDQLVAQGRKIFRDPSMFEHGETCQTCHAEGSASARLGTMVHDTQVPKLSPVPVPTPPSDFDGPRDPPSLFDLDKTQPYFWNGNVPTLDQAVATPVFGHMAAFVPGGKGAPAGQIDCQSNSTRAECVKQAGDIAAALIAYIKTLKAPESAFDDGTMSVQALRGEKLFQGKGAAGRLQESLPARHPDPPQQRHGWARAAARSRVRRDAAAARLRPRGADDVGVRQHPADARPQEHRAVHAQRRVRDAQGRRAVLQHEVDARPPQPHRQRGRRPRGVSELAVAGAQSGRRKDRSASTSATSICAFWSLPA